MRKVTFYRISTADSAGLIWHKVGHYPIPEATDDEMAVDLATKRLEEEHCLSSWETIADVCLVRVF